MRRFLAATACCAFLSGTAIAQDVETLKKRLVQPEETGSVEHEPMEDLSQSWQFEDILLQGRQREASRLTNRYLSNNLENWAKGTPLERVERIRRTDIPLGWSKNGEEESPSRLRLSVRISEEVRLRMGAADFQRDLLYDPLNARMWMDLYQIRLGNGGRTGLTLTDTYQLDEDASQLLLRIHHSWK